MTLESPAYVISADSHSAELFRRTAGTMLSGTGVVGSGDLQVQENGTPNMSVNVVAGQLWTPGTLGATGGMPANLGAQTAYGLPADFTSQGPYQAHNDATTNLAISAANPTNPRIDIVCSEVEDAEYAGSDNQIILTVITGTPAVDPAPPSAPASAVVLAQVAVAANATEIITDNITDVRPLVALLNPLRQNPAALMYNTAQVVSSSSTVQVTAMAEGYAVGDLAVSSNAIVVGRPGIYAVAGAVSWQVSGNPPSASTFAMNIRQNGTTVADSLWNVPESAFRPALPFVGRLQCAAGDELTLWVYASGIVGTYPGEGQTWMAAELVSDLS